MLTGGFVRVGLLHVGAAWSECAGVTNGLKRGLSDRFGASAKCALASIGMRSKSHSQPHARYEPFVDLTLHAMRE